MLGKPAKQLVSKIPPWWSLRTLATFGWLERIFESHLVPERLMPTTKMGRGDSVSSVGRGDSSNAAMFQNIKQESRWNCTASYPRTKLSSFEPIPLSVVANLQVDDFIVTDPRRDGFVWEFVTTGSDRYQVAFCFRSINCPHR